MKKKLLLFIIISLFFINISNIKSLDVTDNNKNTDISGGGGTGSSTTIVNGINGSEMQGIKVAVYRANGNMVSGTTPQYIILRNGNYTTTNFCECSNDTYNFTNANNDGICTCTTNNNITYKSINGITGPNNGTMYWGLYFSKPSTLSSILTSNNYSNLYSILDILGYKNSNGNYNYLEGDYLIVEPLVTVSCKDYTSSQYVTGTINALIKSDFSFVNGTTCGKYTSTKTEMVEKCNVDFHTCLKSSSHGCLQYGTKCETVPKTITTYIDAKDMFRWYYSAIAQSFKTRSESCAVGGQSLHGINFLNKDNYSGCGYNRFDLSQIISEPVNPCTIVTKDGKTTYYNLQRQPVSEDAYKDSCKCREVSENGTTIYFGSNATRVSKNDYEKSCRSCAQRVTNNPIERIGLYNEYKESSSTTDYRNLLDFSKVGANACSTSSEYTINSSCLTLNSDDTFTANNLSKYTYTTDINGKTAYCNSAFTLSSNVGTYFPTVKSGMAYLGGNGMQNTLATGSLTLKCYLYNNNITEGDVNSDPFSSVDYSSFIQNISLSNQNLSLAINSGNTTKNRQGNYVEYTRVYNVQYKMPKVYIDRITGMLVDSPNNNTTENYGLYSKFSDSGTISVPFNVDFGTNMKNVNVVNNSTCSYTAKPEIVVGDLNLKFRTIDTSNPFIGEDGKGRKVGANWCYDNNGTWDCSNNNPLVQSVIKNTTNSYNRNGVTPKYKFVLSPLTINTIREYNNTIPIDEYKTRCSDNVCTNTFFESISDSIIIGRDLLIK